MFKSFRKVLHLFKQIKSFSLKSLVYLNTVKCLKSKYHSWLGSERSNGFEAEIFWLEKYI